MVGRKTSRSCETCRKRRIRCDLEWPACRKCIQAGWKCPGYASRFVHDQRPHSSRAYKNDSMPSPGGMYGDGFSRMPLSDIDALRLEFIHRMEADTLCAALIMMPKGHVLMHIPVFIGHDVALDDAVRCISQSYSPGGSSHSVGHDASYVNALRSLQNALDDPSRVMGPETLAAASLLQMYEAGKNKSDRKWIHHARGVVRMLQTRHINSDTPVIERAILGVQVGTIFLSTVANDDGSFLSRRAWLRIPCRTKTSRGAQADLFTRMVVDGSQDFDKDEFFFQLLGGCRFSKTANDNQRIRIMDIGTKDMLQMRQILLKRSHVHGQLGHTNGPIDTLSIAARVVYGFFLVVTNTFILIMQEQSRDICRNYQSSLKLDEAALRAERFQALLSVSLEYNHLACIDRELSQQLAAALSIVLGTIVPPAESNLYGDREAAELLEIVDRELDDSHYIDKLAR